MLNSITIQCHLQFCINCKVYAKKNKVMYNYYNDNYSRRCGRFHFILSTKSRYLKYFFSFVINLAIKYKRLVYEIKLGCRILVFVKLVLFSVNLFDFSVVRSSFKYIIIKCTSWTNKNFIINISTL